MLAFEGVVQRFGSRVVLDGVDLAVASGERVALVGPSGAGKTTLFRLAYGAFAPTAGRVRHNRNGTGVSTGRFRGTGNPAPFGGGSMREQLHS